MKRLTIALAATALLTAAAAAQDRGDLGGGVARDQFARGDLGDAFERSHWDRGGFRRFSPEDIEAFTDARMAALRAGLRLNPEQERMWPPVEQAIRDLVKLRRDQARAFRESRGDNRDDLSGFLRGMADRQGARAEALRKLADAAGPLYASFDDGQKRRLRILVRQMRPHGMMRHAWRHHEGRGGWRDRDRDD